MAATDPVNRTERLPRLRRHGKPKAELVLLEPARVGNTGEVGSHLTAQARVAVNEQIRFDTKIATTIDGTTVVVRR